MSIARTTGIAPDQGRGTVAEIAKVGIKGGIKAAAAAATFLRRAALGIWVTLLASVTAPAAEFQTHLADDLNIVVVTGEIEPGDDELLPHRGRARYGGRRNTRWSCCRRTVARWARGCTWASSSAEAGLPTFVPEGERCASRLRAGLAGRRARA